MLYCFGTYSILCSLTTSNGLIHNTKELGWKKVLILINLPPPNFATSLLQVFNSIEIIEIIPNITIVRPNLPLWFFVFYSLLMIVGRLLHFLMIVRDKIATNPSKESCDQLKQMTLNLLLLPIRFYGSFIIE